LLVTLPAPRLLGERRSALIISTGKYRDNRLPDLRAPAQDAADLSAVLGDPEYGGFEVTELLDKNKNDIEEALSDFLRAPQRAETVVVYASCHGLQTKWGAYYLAAANTNLDAIPATALEARWLTDRLDECRARRQVVIVDSCFSGAFIGAKGDGRSGLQDWLDAGPGDGFRTGQGRAVLAASRATERSFETGGTAADGAVVRSVFSRALIEGLRTGKADADRDGLVSVMEAFDYASERVQDSGGEQNPRIMYHGEGRIFLVRSPLGRLADPVALLKDSRPEVRIEAVDRVAAWLDDPDPDRVRAALPLLEETAATDIPEVRQVARAHLARRAVRPEPVRTEPPGVAGSPDAEVPASVEAVPAAAEAGAATAGSTPPAGNPSRRWLRLAAVIAIVAAAVVIMVVSVMVDLSRHGSLPSCPAVTRPGFQRVTVPSGAAGTGLTICPVQVDHGQVPGLNVSLSGRILGQVPAGQVVMAVDQPDAGSCAIDGTRGSGGYYPIGTLHPSAAHGDWTVTSGNYYSGAQSMQRHIYFVLGPESAVRSFASSKDAWGATHNGDVSQWPGRRELTGFRVLGTITFTPVEPADRYCRT
jgi:uncharacterized caspase-like protein